MDARIIRYAAIVGSVDLCVSIIFAKYVHLLPIPPPPTDPKLKRLWEFLTRRGTLRPKDVRRMLGVSYPTARKYLRRLRSHLNMPPRRSHAYNTIYLSDLFIYRPQVRHRFQPSNPRHDVFPLWRLTICLQP